MKTAPENCIAWLRRTDRGWALVIDDGDTRTEKLLDDILATAMGARYYILVGSTTGLAGTKTPQTQPEFFEP